MFAHESFDQKNANISIDGGYDSPRNAMNCTSSLMDCRRNKVLGIKNSNKKQLNKSSNMFESYAARENFNDLVERYGKDCCLTITSDNDNKTPNQAKKSGLQLNRTFDPRHGFNCMFRNFAK